MNWIIKTICTMTISSWNMSLFGDNVYIIVWDHTGPIDQMCHLMKAGYFYVELCCIGFYYLLWYLKEILSTYSYQLFRFFFVSKMS